MSGSDTAAAGTFIHNFSFMAVAIGRNKKEKLYEAGASTRSTGALLLPRQSLSLSLSPPAPLSALIHSHRDRSASSPRLHPRAYGLSMARDGFVSLPGRRGRPARTTSRTASQSAPLPSRPRPVEPNLPHRSGGVALPSHKKTPSSRAAARASGPRVGSIDTLTSITHDGASRITQSLRAPRYFIVVSPILLARGRIKLRQLLASVGVEPIACHSWDRSFGHWDRHELRLSDRHLALEGLEGGARRGGRLCCRCWRVGRLPIRRCSADRRLLLDRSAAAHRVALSLLFFQQSEKKL